MTNKDDDHIDTRMRDLQQKIDQLQDGDNAPSTAQDQRSELSRGIGMAVRMGVEMVAALMVGVGAGWGIDQWLDTAPIFVIVGVFLGIGAGISNVYRVARKLGAAVGYKTGGE